MAKKKKMASQVEALKINRKKGYRSLADGKQWDDYTYGNHIRTSAKVGNINRHVSYAATMTTPYLISTYSRYEALRKNRSAIIKRMNSEHKINKTNVANNFADGLVKNEEKLLKKFASVSKMTPGLSAAEIVDELNGMRLMANGFSVEHYVSLIVDDIREMYFRYKSALGKVGADGTRDAVIDVIRNSFETGSPVSLESDVGRNIAYRGNEKHTLLRYQASAQEVFKAMAADQMDYVDLLTPSFALSYMYTAGAQAESQVKGGGFSSGGFSGMNNDFQKMKVKLEKKIKSDTKGVGFKAGWRAYGFLAEIITVYAFGEAVSVYSKSHNEILKEAQAQGKRLNETMVTHVAQVVSGRKEADWGSVDTVLRSQTTLDGNEIKANLPMDVKHTALSSGGKFVYDAGTTINMKSGLYGLFNSETASPDTIKLYRSMVLNIAADRGYALSGRFPLEKQMIIEQELFKEDTLKRKFFSENAAKENDNHGFPLVASIRGNLTLFSEVIRAMGDDKFTVDFAGDRVFNISNPFAIDKPGKIYQQKIIRGRQNIEKNSTGEKSYRAKRIAGFSQKVPGLKDITREIERSYFSGNTNKRVRFKIVLR